MITGMSKITEVLRDSRDGVLEEISRKLSEDFINSGYPFLVLHITEGNRVCFEAITEEYLGRLQLNLSKREGDIGENMADLNMDEVFYHDDFVQDGCLADLNWEVDKSLYHQVREYVGLNSLHCYLCGEKTMKDIMRLPAGSYLMIDCGSALKAMREQTWQKTKGEQAENRCRRM